MQGRNFSYLDTQLKRLGSPNFTHIPVNAPKCPIAHFQQDGHMAMTNPVTRANYEPNSWPAAIAGPRENPSRGFQTYPADESGMMRRIRPESFSDHYSQARQFFMSLTDVEQRHLTDAFVFELSKVERTDIRARMVSGLRNVDDDLARAVADGLGLDQLPEPRPAARPTLQDLPPSAALSIIRNGPRDFAGRTVGILVTDGADAGILSAIRDAAAAEHARVILVAPTVAGIRASDGTHIEVGQKVDGAPSVLYDAVAVITTKEGAGHLARRPAARDFITDAYAHCKFVGYTDDASALLAATGLASALDEGFIELNGNAGDFVAHCRQLRHWARAMATA